MYVCMYVYVYICMYALTKENKNIYSLKKIHTYIHTHRRTQMQTYMYMQACMILAAR
jgi:hypothetical protein